MSEGHGIIPKGIIPLMDVLMNKRGTHGKRRKGQTYGEGSFL